jgi:hypothetical protein
MIRRCTWGTGTLPTDFPELAGWAVPEWEPIQ